MHSPARGRARTSFRLRENLHPRGMMLRFGQFDGYVDKFSDRSMPIQFVEKAYQSVNVDKKTLPIDTGGKRLPLS